MFALAFTVYLIASRFKLWEGASEWRDLVTLALQIFVAISIIYVWPCRIGCRSYDWSRRLYTPMAST